MLEAIANSWKRRVLVLIVALTISNVGQTASQGEVSSQENGAGDEEVLLLGERMYRKGVLPNGEFMQAVVAGDVRVSGRMFSCAGCHQQSGLGSVESSVISWPVNGKELFIPRRRTGAWNASKSQQGSGATQRWSLPEQYQVEDARPAFNDETLARLLRTGIDPGGKQVRPTMPQYQINDDDMAILIHYLKNLSTAPDPGVDDKVIRFATVVTEGVTDEKRNAMLSVLQNHIDVHNTQTRPHLRRAKKGPFYKTEAYGAYRKFKLDVWELKGPRESWEVQLENHYQTNPVFALLGGIASGSWMPIHQFCEKHKIPSIFPITDRPVVSDSDWYTLYFDKGLYQEGEAAARFLRKAEQGGGNVVQVFKPGSRGEAIAKGFEETWKVLGGTGVINTVIGSTDNVSPQWFSRNISSATDTVLLWLEGNNAEALLQDEVFSKNPLNKLFISSTLLNGEVDFIPEDRRKSVFLTHPHSLPEDFKVKSKVLKRWLKLRGISETNLDIKAKMYFLGWMLPGAIKAMRSEFYRDYFLEAFDMMPDQTYAIATYPRLSFGSGQRYMSKGSYVTQLKNDNSAQLKMIGKWITN